MKATQQMPQQLPESILIETKSLLENTPDLSHRLSEFTEVMTHINNQIAKLSEGPEKELFLINYMNLTVFGTTALIADTNSTFNVFNLKVTNSSVNITGQELKPVSFSVFGVDNPTDMWKSVPFIQTQTHEESFTFSFTEGAKIGGSAMVGFDIGLAKGEVTITAELSFEASQSKTVTNTLSYEGTAKVVIPPKSKAGAYIKLDNCVFSGTFTVKYEPEFTEAFLDSPFGKQQYGGKTLQQLFGDIDIVMPQVGTLNGTTGQNWGIGFTIPEPLPPAEVQA